MSRPRFFTDEDVHGTVARLLRTAGFDALSTPETGRIGASDESQLDWADREGRVLVTFNVSDFARIHHQWMKSARGHAGIVVSQQRPPGDLVRRLARLAASLNALDMRDRLEFLANW